MSELAPLLLARYRIDRAESWLTKPRPPFDPPDREAEYYDIAISLELALKAWLALHGYTDEELRRTVGHDLGKARILTSALSLGFPPVLEAVIPLIHPFYMEGGFRHPNRIEWPEALLAEVRLPLRLFFGTIESAVAQAEAQDVAIPPRAFAHGPRRKVVS